VIRNALRDGSRPRCEELRDGGGGVAGEALVGRWPALSRSSFVPALGRERSRMIPFRQFHSENAKAARLPPESGGRRRRERRPLRRRAGQNRRLEAGATRARAARLPFGYAQGKKACATNPRPASLGFSGDKFRPPLRRQRQMQGRPPSARKRRTQKARKAAAVPRLPPAADSLGTTFPCRKCCYRRETDTRSPNPAYAGWPSARRCFFSWLQALICFSRAAAARSEGGPGAKNAALKAAALRLDLNAEEGE